MVYIKCIVEVLLIDVKTVSQNKDIILSMNDLFKDFSIGIICCIMLILLDVCEVENLQHSCLHVSMPFFI